MNDRGRFGIPNPQDFYGGLALVALALFAFWVAGDLQGSRRVSLGPGTAPRLFAGLLAFAGAVVAGFGLTTKGPPVGRYSLRGLVLVTAAVLAFAAMIRPFGLVISTFITILIASTSSSETRWAEAIIWAAALTTFCTILFPYALGLPLPLWPHFLG